MTRSLTPVSLFVLSLTLGLTAAHAQSPTPIIVQAVTSTPAPAAPAATPAAIAKNDADTEMQLKMLRQMKADNDDLLRKQEATLQRLDEIQKAAEQLKIFSKRG
jgi:hypothetical protein